MALEGIDDVHGGDSLSLGVLGVGDGISDDVLKEDLEHSTGLLVDETGDSLHTTTTGQTADGGLGDTLDVVTKNFSVTLGASLAETLASLATTRHDEGELRVRERERRRRSECVERREWNEWREALHATFIDEAQT